MIELCNPGPGDMERQKELWSISFGADDGFCDWYYGTRYRAEQTLVLKADGAVQSMLAGLPMELRSCDGRAFSGAYVFALATHPEYRGEGFGGYLLHYADFRFRDQGKDCALVVPAQPSLHRYFARAGFQEAFSHYEGVAERRELAGPQGRIWAAGAEEYNRMRNERLRGHCYVACDDEAVSLQKGFSKGSGGDIYCLELPQGQGCAAAERAGNGAVIVKELLVPDGAFLSGAALIADELNAASCRFRIPAFQVPPPGGKRCAFGMLKWYLPDEKTPVCENGFLGLAYD